MMVRSARKLHSRSRNDTVGKSWRFAFLSAVPVLGGLTVQSYYQFDGVPTVDQAGATPIFPFLKVAKRCQRRLPAPIHCRRALDRGLVALRKLDRHADHISPRTLAREAPTKRAAAQTVPRAHTDHRLPRRRQQLNQPRSRGSRRRCSPGARRALTLAYRRCALGSICSSYSSPSFRWRSRLSTRRVILRSGTSLPGKI